MEFCGLRTISQKQKKQLLKKAAEIAGFELIIENLKNGDDLEHWADQQQKFHLFDLVLLDLKLANGGMGINWHHAQEHSLSLRQSYFTVPVKVKPNYGKEWPRTVLKESFAQIEEISLIEQPML